MIHYLKVIIFTLAFVGIQNAHCGKTIEAKRDSQCEPTKYKSNQNRLPGRTSEWLYGYQGGSPIYFSDESGFEIRVNPSKITEFNLELDKISQTLVEQLKKVPKDTLLYTFRNKSYRVINESEYDKLSTTHRTTVSISDCVAISGEEKRLSIQLEVGDYYKDGKYIYAFGVDKDGKLKLLLGNPKLLDLNKKLDIRQIANSIVGEETVDTKEILDTVSREANNLLPSDYNYKIINPAPECLNIDYHDRIRNQNYGCAQLPPSGPTPPARLTRPNRSGVF